MLDHGSNGNGGANATAGGDSSDTGPGFSEVDLNAEQNGGLTPAGSPTADNSLGLDIEYVGFCDFAAWGVDMRFALPERTMLGTLLPFRWELLPGTSSCSWTLDLLIFGSAASSASLRMAVTA